MNVFWLFLNQFYVFHTFVTCPNYFNNFPLCLLESELSALPDPKVQNYYVLDVFLMFAWKTIQNTDFLKKHPRCCRATGEHWRALASISGSLSSNWRALASTGEQMVMLGELQILPHICTFSSVLVCFVCFSVFCLLFHVLYVFHCFCRFCAVSKALRQK